MKEFIAKLLKKAQEDKDDSVSYNEFNKVVQSHRTGIQYISIDDVEQLLKEEKVFDQ